MSDNKLYYYQDKFLELGFGFGNGKPTIFHPDSETLDSMDDLEYNAFVRALKQFHDEHYPSSCLYIPRRKTKEERLKEETELKNLWEKLGRK